MKNNNFLFIGVIGAAIVGAYLYFKNQCEAGTGATGICNLPFFPPTIDSSVMSAASLATMITQAQAQGLSNSQVQALLNNLATQKAACKSPSTWDPNGAICTGMVPVGTVVNTTPNGSGSGTTTTTPTTTSDPWANAISLMKMNAGSNSQNLDQWAWQFQYSVPPSGASLPTGFGQGGYITPAIMQSIINAAGGDRTKQITAEAFVGYLRQVLSSIGISGLYEIPVWMIHQGSMGVM